MIRRIMLAVALLAAPSIIVAEQPTVVHAQQADSSKTMKKPAKKHAGKKKTAKKPAADTTKAK
jgi:ABC-type dipeptide/oligopeptide/nickel transport system ATPase component